MVQSRGGAGWLGLGLGTWESWVTAHGRARAGARSHPNLGRWADAEGLGPPACLNLSQRQIPFHSLSISTLGHMKHPVSPPSISFFKSCCPKQKNHLHESALSRRFATLTRSMSIPNWGRALFCSPSLTSRDLKFDLDSGLFPPLMSRTDRSWHYTCLEYSASTHYRSNGSWVRQQFSGVGVHRVHVAVALTPAGAACHSPAARTMCCAALMRLDIREAPLTPNPGSMVHVGNSDSDLTLRHLGDQFPAQNITSPWPPALRAQKPPTCRRRQANQCLVSKSAIDDLHQRKGEGHVPA